MDARGPRALVLGMPYFAPATARLLEERGWRTIVHKPVGGPWRRRVDFARFIARVPGVDVVHQIGGPVVPPRLFGMCRAANKPIALHWAGTDVLFAAGNDRVREQDQSGLITHFAGAPWLAEELGAAGIGATYVPLNAVDGSPPLPLPPPPLTVLCYVPEGKFEFYGGAEVIELARSLPGVRFVVVGGRDLMRPWPLNVRRLGWVDDMQAVYARSHVILRLTKHDGLSFMAVEALAKGRYVVWTHDLPGVISVEDCTAAARRLGDLQRRLEDGDLPVNERGSDFAVHAFERGAAGARLDDALRSVAQHRRTRRWPVVVVGTPYFGARAASLLNSAGFAASRLCADTTAPLWRRRMSVARAVADVVGGAALYQIGGPRISGKLRAAAAVAHRPVVLHWVGTDVLRLHGDVALRAECTDETIVHWADAPWLAAELAEFGISARVVPLAAIPNVPPAPFPAGPFTVLAYCPAWRFEFYGGPAVMTLARALPDVRFDVLANDGASVIAKPANVRFRGWQEKMTAVYASSHALVRLPEHDGLSFMVLEAMGHERPVIWNRPFDGATLAIDVETAEAHVRALRDAYARGESIRNARGRAFVLRTFDWRETRNRLADEMAAAIGGAARTDYAHA